MNDTFETKHFSIYENTAWKEEEYSSLNNIFAISYLWQPLITVVSTVVFGLIFSLCIQTRKKYARVKSGYLTPLVTSMWIKIFGKDRLAQWVEFEDLNANKLENPKDVYSMGTIPRAKFNLQVQLPHRSKITRGSF